MCKQTVWSTLRERDTELPELKYELSCLKASVESQFSAVSDLRAVHMQQEGSISTQVSTIVDVEGDMRKLLGTVKQLELASKSQAASIRALEIASKSQSRCELFFLLTLLVICFRVFSYSPSPSLHFIICSVLL